MVYAVVRIRGTVNVNPQIKRTLQLLRLTRANHCTLVQETDEMKGMLQKAKDYITWGEIDEAMLTRLLQHRGRIKGDTALTEEYVSSATSCKNMETLAKALIDQSIKLNEVPDLKPVFRLHPPNNGFEGIKRSYKMNGALGYRGSAINTLLERMI